MSIVNTVGNASKSPVSAGQVMPTKVEFGRLAVHTINHQTDLSIGLQFLYSRMKYGDPTAIKQWAFMLKVAILADPVIGAEVKAGNSIVLTSSAYGAVRTASNAVMKQLALLLQAEGIKFETTKISRSGDFSLTHYGTMTVAERVMRMVNRRVTISSHCRSKISGKVVVIVDDLRATGSHENTLMKLFSTTTARACRFAYLVEFSSMLATTSPEVEEKLNSASVRKLADLLPFYLNSSDEVEVNARTLKFIFCTNPQGKKDQAERIKELYLFLQSLDDVMLLKLFRVMTSRDGYYKFDRFIYGFHALSNVLTARHIVSLQEIQQLKKTFTLRNVTVDQDGNLTDLETGEDLNYLGRFYSLMKLGSREHIVWFGEQIAEKIISQLSAGTGPIAEVIAEIEKNGGHAVMVSPGSRNVESAQNFIYEVAVRRINTWLALNSKPTIILMKLSRLGSGGANYSELGASERLRQKLQSRSTRSIMPADDLFSAGVHVIFADDARITGASADRIEAYCLEKGARSFSSIYCIVVDTVVTLANPAVEHFLNHFYVEDKLDQRMLGILNQDGFQPVQRTLRLLLKEKNRPQLRQFLPAVSESALLKVYQACLNNDYLGDARYSASISVLKKELERRRLLTKSGLPQLTGISKEFSA